MINKIIRMGDLYDFYGGLLTSKQKRMIELYFLNDLSLSEIAEQFSVTRQAVRDVLVRAEQQLENYENRLKLVEKFSKSRLDIQKLLDVLYLAEQQAAGTGSPAVVANTIDYAINLALQVKQTLG